MKKILIIVLVAITVTLTGCSINRVNSKNITNDKSQTHNPFVQMKPSIDKFFINSKEGWGAVNVFHGMFNGDIILYKTKDGGKTWVKIADDRDKGSTLPGGYLIGMSFSNSINGWITIDAPRDGNLDLFRTLDGGVNWKEQKPQIPSKFQNSQMTTIPPLFFTKSKGILLAKVWGDKKQDFLFYITEDGGKTWIVMPEKENGQYDEINWCFKKSTISNDIENTYEVTFHNSTWNVVNEKWINKKDYIENILNW